MRLLLFIWYLKTIFAQKPGSMTWLDDLVAYYFPDIVCFLSFCFANHLFWTKQHWGEQEGAHVSGHPGEHVVIGIGGGGGGGGGGLTGRYIVCSGVCWQHAASHAGQQFKSPLHGAGQFAIGYNMLWSSSPGKFQKVTLNNCFNDDHETNTVRKSCCGILDMIFK